MIGYGDFRARQAAARAGGRHLGLGVAAYVEGTGIGPYEGALVRVEPSGKVFVTTGLTTHGQGHPTTFAQIAAEALGCDPADVTVVTGDTGRFNWGAGTFASRALVTSGNAVSVAALVVRDKALRLAGLLLEASPADLELVDGAIRVKGAPDRRLTLGALATVADPIRYAYGTESSEAALRLVKPREGPVLAPGEEPGLEANGYYAPPQATFASGFHAAIVEVDIRTGEIAIVKYVVQHDCGIMVNPTVVEGQVHGGVAQGIGGALYEKIVYDERGQLLTGTFMDFLIPTAMEVPDMEVGHIETRSPLNPLGVKGVGEAGAIPVPALIAEAVDDALSPWGVRVREMPLSPGAILALVDQAPRPPGNQGPIYDRELLLSRPKRNATLELWEVQRYGTDSYGDADYVSIYGMRPADWYANGVRLLGRTAVECTRDGLADAIGRDVAAIAGTAPTTAGALVIDPFAGSGNTLYWMLRHLPDARGLGFELDATVFQLTSRNLAALALPIDMVNTDYLSGLAGATVPADHLLITFIAPPWGDALNKTRGLDLRHTTPPITDIVDFLLDVFPHNRFLCAIQVHETVDSASMEELTSRFDWSSLRVYALNAAGENHGILLGSKNWTP
jgi:hypothetical protein